MADYRDGIGVARCGTCHQALRDAAEGELMSLRVADVRQVVYILSDLCSLGVETEAITSLIDRLSRAIGQSVKQIRKEQAHAGETKPD